MPRANAALGDIRSVLAGLGIGPNDLTGGVYGRGCCAAPHAGTRVRALTQCWVTAKTSQPPSAMTSLADGWPALAVIRQEPPSDVSAYASYLGLGRVWPERQGIYACPLLRLGKVGNVLADVAA